MTNPKLQINSNYQNPNEECYDKAYDLEERTFSFAKNISIFCKQLSRNISNIEYIKQVVRSSGSVGANYIEANESLGKKDFLMRIRISLKEAKETAYWLRLIVETNNDSFQEEGLSLRGEAVELKKILSSILVKSQ